MQIGTGLRRTVPAPDDGVMPGKPSRADVVSGVSHAYYTIGHSTRSVAELAELLSDAGARMVVDVRTVPRSRTNPQFNRDTLPEALAAYGLRYEHVAALGGLRGASAGAGSPNTFWENRSFRNYADYAMTPAFREGLARLCALGRETPCAVMCAEAVWWRCHRRIIADYLLSAGEQVFHIMGLGRLEPAKLTSAARRTNTGSLEYPASSRAGASTTFP